jgi:hypothetical protein
MNEIFSTLNSIQDSNKRLLKVIRDLEEKLEGLIRALNSAIRKLDRRPDHEAIARMIKMDITTDAKNMLWENAKSALASTGEFNREPFIEDLKSCVYNTGTYKVLYDNTRYYLDIDLDKTAGTVEDYANAVSAARDKFRMTLSPEAASNLWKRFIYPIGTGQTSYFSKKLKKDGTPKINSMANEKFKRYYNTVIKLRKENFGSIAPWWSILNYGTGRKLSSDRGGTTYPFYSSGTKFVEKTEMGMQAEIDSITQENENDYFEWIRMDIDSLYRIIAKTRLELAKLKDIKEEDHRTVIEQIRDHLYSYYNDDRIKQIEKGRLENLIDNALLGKALPKRVRLGKRAGLPGGAPRIRVEQIKKEILRVRDELEKLRG